MGFTGSSVNSPNRRLQFLGIVFIGIVAFASLLYWRQQTLVASEYVEFPQNDNPKHVKKATKSELRSKNFQIDTEDVSPSVK